MWLVNYKPLEFSFCRPRGFEPVGWMTWEDASRSAAANSVILGRHTFTLDLWRWESTSFIRASPSGSMQRTWKKEGCSVCELTRSLAAPVILSLHWSLFLLDSSVYRRPAEAPSLVCCVTTGFLDFYRYTIVVGLP